MEGKRYNSADPFFVVRCRDCGKEYWSTIRANDACVKCGSTNISTSAPKHNIKNYNFQKK